MILQKGKFMANPLETNGMFSWFELMSADIEKAKKFYGEVIGWDFVQDSNNPDFTLIKTKGVDHPVAGIFKRDNAISNTPENIPPHWGCYITVEDIQTAVEKVKSLGGHIIVPITAIPKVGKFSVIQDLEGAVVSLMEYHLEV
jgi:predicted enzyme related to lactoylglutathione lyase